MSFTWQVRIRFVDTDASGRIHYTAMFRYFEAAEFEYLRACGTTYEDFPEYGFPRVHVECDYSSATKCDDLLNIGVGIAQMGHSSFTYSFAATITSRSVAEGSITVVCVSKATGKPVELPAQLRDAIHLPLTTRV